ncbi:hypothetical protein BOO86_27860 [Mycobacterium sp. CBMA 234]|uniref:hypothetical protein n=1 Tax=Mycolicibacterium sp. CBMA 234 TaxID=1918495 RepID=UPI0012DF96A8|nr:hypothetical protein [Mycolicibacterium sp. CBMA 234]MUL68315.1 hypothetical protein [Mycolicibacterium sp. CBMA 234]
MPAATGGALTRSDIEAWDTNHLEAAATHFKSVAGHWEGHFETIHQGMLRPGGTPWEGTAADAAAERSWGDLVKVRGAADPLYAAAGHATTGAGDVAWAKRQVLDAIAEAEEAGFTVGQDFSVTDKSSGGAMRSTPGRQQKAQAFVDEISNRVRALVAIDKQVATQITAALAPLGGIGFNEPVSTTEPPEKERQPIMQAAGYGIKQDVPKASNAEPEGNRHQNQIDAFRHVFSREPVSRADWDTAAALDPHSYDPKNGGVPPNITVGTITPRPGQGVVRTNLFIPGESVLDPQLTSLPHSNLGDNRGFSPTVSPEASRVSILVDYENGIIVARQNPSVDATTGHIQAGTPTVSAVQRSDGGILLHYNAADPFSPGGQDVAKSIPFSVNGELAITPTPNGPVVGGNVTNYPAMEIYHDGASGPSQVLAQQWPLVSDGSTGPGAGLWWHRPIGDASLVLGFNDLNPALPGVPVPGALPPHGGPTAVPAAPPLIATPPGLSDLGPVGAPPAVRHHDPVVTLPPLPPH